MALESYLDFAENDYKFIKDAYDRGAVGNAMGALCQNTCEKYMKHLIQEFCEPENHMEASKKETALKSHNLLRLMNFIKENLQMEFSEEAQTAMREIDGYYFSTRYPGDNSVELSIKDITRCVNAVSFCRQGVCELLAYIQTREQTESAETSQESNERYSLT